MMIKTVDLYLAKLVLDISMLVGWYDSWRKLNGCAHKIAVELHAAAVEILLENDSEGWKWRPISVLPSSF